MDTTDVAPAWGRAIRAHRKAAGLSQDALAAACGVSQSTVSKWEQGIAAPSHRLVPAVARALHTVPSVLFQYPTDNGGPR